MGERMSRGNILGNGNLFKGEQNPDKKEFRPPEERLVDSELIDRLLDHYNEECYSAKYDLRIYESFHTLVQKLTLIIRKERLNSIIAPFIDLFASRLKDESGNKNDKFDTFTKTDYLTAVVQALYNLGYGNKLSIDVRDWPENIDWSKNRMSIGTFLKGKASKPLTLNLYGNLYSCGTFAEFCHFIFQEMSEVWFCGAEAENCTFDRMHGCAISEYRAKESENNLLRKMNDKGEWVELEGVIRPFQRL